jgi:hypothetical protein
MAFTLSQAGMVMHWKRAGHATRSMIVNGIGATATAITVAVVLAAKFAEGAWITLLLIPGLMLLMWTVRRHYDREEEEIRTDRPIDVTDLHPPLVVVPIVRWDAISEKALRFAWTISPDIRVVHVECGEETELLRRQWVQLVEAPANAAGLPVPALVVLPSPFRWVIKPLVAYILHLQTDDPGRHIAVLIPELVEKHWYYSLLHNNRSAILKAMLLFKGNHRTAVINIPWYLGDRRT